MEDHTSVEHRAARVKFAFDGLRRSSHHGSIWVLENGDDQKGFNTRDGLGLNSFASQWALSRALFQGDGRVRSNVVPQRWAFPIFRQGWENKLKAFEEILCGVRGEQSRRSHLSATTSMTLH